MCLLCRFLYAPVCCYPLADSPVLPSVSPASRRCFSTPKKLANTSLYSPALPLAAHLLPHYFILLIPVLVLCFPSHMRSLAHNQVAKLNNLYHLCKLFRFFVIFSSFFRLYLRFGNHPARYFSDCPPPGPGFLVSHLLTKN